MQYNSCAHNTAYSAQNNIGSQWKLLAHHKLGVECMLLPPSIGHGALLGQYLPRTFSSVLG
jgi:hypothetical protein